MKKIVLLFFCLFSLISVNAQDIRMVFGKMPVRLIQLVDSIQRQDLMDMYVNKQTAQVKNKLNGTSELKAFSSDYMLLQTGSASLEIILLPMVNDTKIICTINTYCAPVCDSELKFYTTDWKLLDTNIFITPADASWFIKNDIDKTSQEFKIVANMLDMDLMQFHFDNEKLILNQTYNTPQYLSKEDREKIQPFLKNEPKTFIWNKSTFK